jgi:hypothetical protein
MSLLLQLAGNALVLTGGIRLLRYRRTLPGRTVKGADLDTRRRAMRKFAECSLLMVAGALLLLIAISLQTQIPRWVLIVYGVWGVGGGILYYAFAPKLVRR